MSRRLYRDHLGPKFSEAARLVWLAMAERGWSQSDLARELETDTENVCRWLYGDRRPTRPFDRRFRVLLGVDESLWDADPTEPFTPPALEQRTALQATGTEGM
jgi:transcriptional regulator with XRE-family HTH domain